ncbi:MAG TPA: NADH-quinone oxidoreductase subunit H [Gaiellaceae bacterium]|nr:NADH-quinone oxidoreductase subunit H [Gaiellaceae bacterium]
MPQLNDGWIEVLQVGTILLVSPLVTGLIARAEAIIQGRRGPRFLQPYYDIAKFFRKETVLPEGAGPMFRVAPYVSFACYCVVPLIIPVLTAFPPQGAYLADILGGGLILGLASYSVSLAAIDSGSPYAQLGSSRVRTFGALGEPIVLFVVFTVALITQTDLPYAFAKTLESSSVEIVRPSHLLAAAAFFMVVLSETGRIPIESHGGTLEFGLIEEGRTLEHSGPGMALLKWGSSMKQLILYVILLDALVVPWGISQSRSLGDVLLAVLYLFLKAAGLGLVVVGIESSFAKLRLYKIPEFTVAAFLLAVLAVVMFVLQRSYGLVHLNVFGGVASVVAVVVLLLEFGLLRSQDIWEQLRLYGLGSFAVAAMAIVAGWKLGGADLYTIAAVTIAFKGFVIPLGVGAIIRNLDVETRVPSLVKAPSAVLLGIFLASFSFIAFSHLQIGGAAPLPVEALGVAVAVVVLAFLLMIVRPYAPSQLIGFLVLENGVTLASLVVAPSLPLILVLLLLFDVFIGLLVFVLLVQYFGLHRTAVTTDVLTRLRG